MGSIITPICTSCDRSFHSIALGRNMMEDGLVTDRQAAGCYDCGNIFQVEHPDKLRECPNCGRNENLRILNSGDTCPGCGKGNILFDLDILTD